MNESVCYLDDLTVNIKQTYSEISPFLYPPVEYLCGRPLNLADDAESMDQGNTDGHRIVCVNEIFEDAEHNQFRVIDVLGNGTFSYVFKCQSISDPSTFVALKIIKNLRPYRATGISEVMVHQRMSNAPDHPGKQHVIMPITSFEVEGHVCLVLPLFHRSLFEGLCQTQAASELLGNIRSIMEQLLQSLDFIHRNGIMHCDLKPDNILFSDEDFENIVLIDFGSSSTAGSGVNQYIQSRFYRSPEVMLGLPYDNLIDMWSAGCVAAELYLDFALFACENELDAIHSMAALLGPFPQNLISKSSHWRRFFDMNPQGFVLKMDPIEVLLNNHSYHQIFEQIGAVPLAQLIQEHCPITSQEELDMVNSFNHFIHCLLTYDSSVRLTAFQALSHPFITGDVHNENWNPPPVQRVAIRQQTPTNERPKTSSVGDLETIDFLDLM